MGENNSPVNIAKAAVEHAKKEGCNLVFLDTAGRLQIDEAMMEELVQIKEAVHVDQTILVVDAMTGQDAVNVAGSFNDKIGVDGVILTKLDGDTRGALSQAAPSCMWVWEKSFPTWNSFIPTGWLPGSWEWAISFP